MCWLMTARRVVADERRPAGDQLVEHAAERVEVGARRRLAAERLLRRHVGDGADEHAVHRQARLLEGDGEAEVADLRRAVGGEPDVAGLEVAVDDAVLVGVREPAADALRDLQRALRRSAAGRAPSTAPPDMYWLTMYGCAVVVADVVDGDDVRVVAELAHRLRFALHAREARVVEPSVLMTATATSRSSCSSCAR